MDVKPPQKRERQARPCYWRSPWGQMWEKGDFRNPQTKAGRKFRRRWRVPPTVCDQLLDDLEALGFRRATHYKNQTVTLAPLELLLLSVLRVAGRGWTFDDCEEQTWIDEETIRVFYHRCSAAIGQGLWDKHVRFPKTEQDLDRISDTFEDIGFPRLAGTQSLSHK